jgi:hypothetical protein
MGSKEFLLSKEKHLSKKGNVFTVVEFKNSRNVVIRFVETGFTTTVQAGNAVRGMVHDKLAPSVWGLGFIGEGEYPSKIGRSNTLAYETWSSMFKRCYSEKVHKSRPTYKECTVHPDWHNFQVFAEWFQENHFLGAQLDKDILVENNKVYGPTTCLMVTQQQNAAKAFAKDYVLLSPEGERISVHNLRQFCISRGLSISNMYSVVVGLRTHSNNWSLYHAA